KELSDETAQRQDELEERWETVLAETTDFAEVIDARTGLRGTSWPTIKGRLDSMQAIDDKLNPVSEIFSIEHNQNCYPVVRVLAFENGLGIGPLGVNLGGSNTTTVNCDVEYMGRNNLKIKVPLSFAMTNPITERISANEYLLVEGIKSLIIEVGTKAEANVETFITKEIESDFTGKIAGSNVENANNLKWNHKATLGLPIDSWNSATQTYINMLYKLDNVAFAVTTATGASGLMPQTLIEFNIFRILEQNFPSIFKSVATDSEKLSIVKNSVNSLKYDVFGIGKSPANNTIYTVAWKHEDNLYGNQKIVTGTTIQNVGNSLTGDYMKAFFTPKGFLNIVVYANASSELVASKVSVDYA
ncbi:hypothetical protein, partial [Carnobacterium maltaromaticum]|uniref:hypothetical protein n=1 Tax=Carnobacterium maltaromaticum TaxID=2751 RepID=UPI0039AEEE64